LNAVAEPTSVTDVILLVAASALDGLALVLLALALRHQRLYRSGSKRDSPPPPRGARRSLRLMGRATHLCAQTHMYRCQGA
jgi:hypothetical protein